jgi:hypothetical protein
MPPEDLPYGMLYADDQAVWYARHSRTLRSEGDDGSWYAAVEFVRHALDTGTETVLVADATPDALFPIDGVTLGFLPWGYENSLAKADFAAQADLLALEVDDSIIWDALSLDDALYLVLYNDEADEEFLYRAVGETVERLADPTPTPTVSWLTGNFRVYAGAEGALYAAPLTNPGRAHALSTSGGKSDAFYFEDNRFVCEVLEGNMARLYRVPLAEGEAVRLLEFAATPRWFVRGVGGDEFVTLDRDGRLLSASGDFTQLTQLAQLEPAALFGGGDWLWALPFPEYVVLLGYSDAPEDPSGLALPPDMVRVVRRGEGLPAGQPVPLTETEPTETEPTK